MYEWLESMSWEKSRRKTSVQQEINQKVAQRSSWILDKSMELRAWATVLRILPAGRGFEEATELDAPRCINPLGFSLIFQRNLNQVRVRNMCDSGVCSSWHVKPSLGAAQPGHRFCALCPSAICAVDYAPCWQSGSYPYLLKWGWRISSPGLCLDWERWRQEGVLSSRRVCAEEARVIDHCRGTI